MGAKHHATPELLRRHQAAMEIIRHVDETDRILLLAYVVAPTPRIREAERELSALRERHHSEAAA